MPPVPPEWQALRRVMEFLSEEVWYAGWLADTEYDLWRLVQDGGTWGRGTAESLRADLDALRALSDRLGLWARWDDELEDVVPVPLDEWRAMYAAR